ncbi:MAG: hypothetical protein KAH72_02130, partial [Flavobacteriaceae bacterium]|nr:hypothetical protein [Flavobacteriaceae bacterium]
MKKILTLLLILNTIFAFGQDITTGLVAYYRFNNNALDESGYGFNGTVYGATLTTDKDGNANSAYSFDGVDD